MRCESFMREVVAAERGQHLFLWVTVPICVAMWAIPGIYGVLLVRRNAPTYEVVAAAAICLGGCCLAYVVAARAIKQLPTVQCDSCKAVLTVSEGRAMAEGEACPKCQATLKGVA
jgi:hypothetical protein